MCLEINIVSQCDRCSSYSYILYNNYRLIWTLADTLKFVVHIIATLKFKTFFIDNFKVFRFENKTLQ